MKNILSMLFLLATVNVLSAQVESEIGFKYIKAKYLVDTERYEDAIRTFTNIIKEDPSYEEALLYRAEAKYYMSAYKGTKKDVLQYIETKGASAKALALLGKSSYKMNDKAAAANTLALVSPISSDMTVDEYLGNSLYALGDTNGACNAWSRAAQRGSSNAAIRARENCGNYTQQPSRTHTTPSTSPAPQEKPSTDGVIKIKIPSTADNASDRPSRDSGIPKDMPSKPKRNDTPTTSKPSYDPSIPPSDNTKNTIKIDEDLVIDIYGQGLGKRKVMDKPNILILSDTDGIVTVDICVNARGKVESAEYNSSKSTLSKDHLISLAIRKAKEFWFATSEYKNQCGVMQFRISSM